MIHVSAILNAHAEGALAGPSLRSFELSISMARAAGLAVESIIVLDKPDDATIAQFSNAASYGHRIVLSDAGDLGLARNVGARNARGKYVAFLDGDDLWGFNWLADAWRFCTGQGRVVAHPEVYLLFGLTNALVVHIDSESSEFYLDGLRVANFWDSLAFSSREVFLEYPYAHKDFAAGFGYEDWHWNSLTLSGGVPHRPVPGTIHFKRRRPGSLVAESADNDVIPFPTGITAYERLGAAG